MGTEKPADSSSVDMGDSNRRQLSPDERGYVAGQHGNTYMSYDVVTNEQSPRSSPQPLAVTDWPVRPYPDLSQEPVWVVPPYREPVIMGYGPTWVAPDGSMTKLYDDDWSGRRPKRGRRRLIRNPESDDDPPTIVFTRGCCLCGRIRRARCRPCCYHRPCLHTELIVTPAARACIYHLSIIVIVNSAPVSLRFVETVDVTIFDVFILGDTITVLYFMSWINSY
ncbi:uncharacterized protein LOC124285661 [Haliotis rubra]|uniref:uncharacterized protein LOC124285661 n=1 Tax=Haliotis rubra TaxID=36100 RepID=UPI001EE534CA|nr:uncharacterized protein LOC124285661 [Haliotis rubra]